jgi:predicted peptidase
VRLKLLLALLVLLTSATCTKEPRFLDRSVTVGERTFRYRVWLPARYTKLHHWPVVLFLHDAAERGDDNARQLAAGLAPVLDRDPYRFKSIVVFPQCRPGEEWYGEMETQALAALDDAIAEFHGDRRRVTITGIGMGGSGAWYIARHRRRFAAVVPIAGEVAHKNEPFPSDPPPDVARIVGLPDPYSALAKEIGDTPVWAFHGARDSVTPVAESRAMVAALQANGGRARYSEFSALGHNAWDVAYSSADFLKWLRKQRR